MITRAVARYLRISPRKTRKVLDLIRGQEVVKAQALLDTLNKRPTTCIRRLLKSALDSADKKAGLSPADLYISRIQADGGPMLKRYRAATMGRATMIRHRTTHIAIELDEIGKRGKGQEVKDKKSAAGETKQETKVKHKAVKNKITKAGRKVKKEAKKVAGKKK